MIIMGNFSIRGTKYRHLPSGSECVVLVDFPDRHRVRIQLDSGQELDEVAYHDLADAAPAVKLPPTKAVSEPATVVEEAEPRAPEAYPMRRRVGWNRGTPRGGAPTEEDA